MIPVQVRTFVNRVLEETESGFLNWYEGYDGSYICENKSITLHISHGYDEYRDTYFYAFKIVKGYQVTPFSVVSSEDDYFIMKRLYEAVIISVNNISDDLNSFFD